MAWQMLGDKPFSTNYITQNYYYNLGTIKISTLVIHSVGTGSKRTTSEWRDAWDKKTSKNNVSCVVGPDEGIIMLPSFEKAGYGMKCAGCGSGKNGSYNATSLQVEMQEDYRIKYTSGAKFTTSDPQATAEYQLEVLDTAIQFLANAAIFHNLDVTKPGVLVSHKEACVKYGKASNHGDIEHLFEQLPMNMTMDKVRQLVAERVEEYKLEKELNEMTDTQFETLMNRYLTNQAKQKNSTYSTEDLEWAIKNGILASKSVTDSATRPMSFATREEEIAFLHRYNKKFGDGT